MRKRLIFSVSNDQIKTASAVIADAAVLDLSVALPASGIGCGVENNNNSNLNKT